MGLTLGEALRLLPTTRAGDESPAPPSVAFVGAGGKTTAIFHLARQFKGPVLITSTTHLGEWQLADADRHIVARLPADVELSGDAKVTVVTGPIQDDQRTAPASPAVLQELHQQALTRGLPLLIEADGARQRPLKAPAAHEPAIPGYASHVVVVAGLGGLGKPLDEATVHRAEVFSDLGDLRHGEEITASALGSVLMHPQGGLKNVPAGARRVALLNQADTPTLQAEASRLAPRLLSAFDAVVLASLLEGAIHAVWEPASAVILAAGESTRLGRPKQLLMWKDQPFVRSVAATALEAGLSPVVVVTGAGADLVESVVGDLPVVIARNDDWRDGQASSIRRGLSALPPRAGSVTFLLADQPQVTVSVIRALLETHSTGLHPIVAPLIRGEYRGNPILFDRHTFGDLRHLRGDVGGRSLFSKYRVQYLPWHDELLLLDVDTQEDYDRLIQGSQ